MEFLELECKVSKKEYEEFDNSSDDEAPVAGPSRIITRSKQNLSYQQHLLEMENKTEKKATKRPKMK